ncbi:thermonuclease family protein [Planococcus sp. CAU13]|uniref:thermonuclease family protein n=1 Tax=Planococcus sp. CAU13 TaxID=1541197 RepID=UPI0005300C29|nr:thermonuclease family protein [Planococcus sp. CAU13]
MKNIFAVLLALLLAGCSLPGSTDTGGSSNQVPAEVLSVIDGDTVRILYEGEETTVRYLLIDTPETNHPRFGEQPLGKEATEENRRLIESGDVTIEFDVGDRLDDYGRLLVYLYVDGESVQEQLLQSGHARLAYVFPPNTRYLDEFEAAEQQAKEQSLGIWEFEGYATDRGFDSGAITKSNLSNNDSNSEECAIKGNINRNGDKIYHMPGSPSYEQTNPEEWFCSEQEAWDNGFRSPAQ